MRILQVDSANGKVLKKKKTGVKSGTRDPGRFFLLKWDFPKNVIISDGTLPAEFNETLNFDVESEALLTTVVFLLMVSHRSVPEVRKASLTLWSLNRA